MGKHRKPFREQRRPVINIDENFFQPPPPVPLAYQPPQYEPKPVVNIDLLGAKNATVARVKLAKHKDWTAAGAVYQFESAEASKREQGDVTDPLTGELLALARAFQRLSRDLFREGHKRVRKASEEKAAAEEAAEAKARHLPVEVHRRTKEEWEAVQQKRYEQQGGKFDLKEVKRSLVDNPIRAEASIRYNPQDTEILARWIKHEAHDVEALKAKKKEIEETLRLLGETD